MKIFIFLLFTLLFSVQINGENTVYSDIKNNSNVSSIFTQSDVLIAKRSGGRAGGSSFSSRSSSSSSSSGSSFGGSSRSYGSSSTNYGSSRSYGSGGGFIFFGTGSSTSSFLILLGIIFIIGIFQYLKKRSQQNGSDSDEEYQSIKLQFALHATAIDLKYQLKELAESLNFDNDDDLKKLVSQSAYLLMQKEDYLKYGKILQSEKTRNLNQAEVLYDGFVNEEIDKFSQETYKKLENKSSIIQKLTEENKPNFMEIKEYFVFTLVVSYANFKITVPDDYSWETYKQILNKVASIPTAAIVAAEIIWTPDADEDILTEDDVLMSYPYFTTL